MKLLLRLVLLFTILAFNLNETFAQRKFLLFESFDDEGGISSTLNAGGGPWSTTGYNSWYVNMAYKGGNGVPDVPSQKRTSMGQINAPDSNYLKITALEYYNNNIRNANFDPSRSSDVFTYLGEMCTIDLDTIEMSYFWLGDGDDNAYATFMVNIEGAGWKPLISTDGRDKLKRFPEDRNQAPLWKYELYRSTSELANKRNVQIGIRWTNNGGGGNPRISFGFDDFFVVGARDRGRKSAELFLSNLNPLEICQGGGFNFQLTHSFPLCLGDYEIQLSSETGSFETYTVLGRPRRIDLPEMFGPITMGGGLPCGITPGTRYKIRVVRRSKYLPNEITSNELGPVTVSYCNDWIRTRSMTTAAMDDTLRPSVCVGSWLIYTFNSAFCFLADNEYWLEISDENGVFEDANGKFLGQVLQKTPDNNPYPAIPPGSFFVKIPDRDVPGQTADGRDTILNWKPFASCKYRWRVRSTNPALVSAPAQGTFCIKDCSIETNKTEFITICIDPDKDTVLKIPFWGFRFDRRIVYGPNNRFEWQLFNYQQSTTIPVHQGAFGSEAFTDADLKTRGAFPPPFPGQDPNNPDYQYWDTLKLTIPNLNRLIQLGSPPGSYFIRIVATDAKLNEGDGRFTDVQGTLIPITIGAPFKEGPNMFLKDSITAFCTNEEFIIFIYGTKFVAAKNSQYAWYLFPSERKLSPEEQDTLAQLIEDGSFGPGQVMQPRVNFFPYNGDTGVAGWIINPRTMPNVRYMYYFSQEVSGGVCRGPASNPIEIPLRSFPPTVVDGLPNSPCANQTIKLKVRFNPETFYSWKVDSSAVRDTNNQSNTELVVKFIKPGVYKLDLTTINKCGNEDTSFKLRLFPQPLLDTAKTYYGCLNDKVVLEGRLDSTSFAFDQSLGTWDVKYEWVDEGNNVLRSGAFSSNFGQAIKLDRTVDKNEKIRLRVSSLYTIAEENRQDSVDLPQTVPCVDEIEMSVKMFEVEAQAKQSYTICKGNSVTLLASGGDRYIWEENPTLKGLDIPNPIAQPETTTVYKVKVLKAFPELSGRLCEDTISVKVTVITAPDDTAEVVFCEGNRYILDSKQENVRYQWYDMNRNNRSLGKGKTQAITTAGLYRVEITNPDKENECSFSQFYSATTIEPTASKEKIINDCRGLKFKLEAPECIRCKYEWQTEAKDTTRVIEVSKEGTYIVKVIVLDEFGAEYCNSTITYVAEYGEACKKNLYKLEIPNAFSPNNDDKKINEKWVVWTPTMKSYKAMVFDRWGHKVFEAEHNQEMMPREVNPLDGQAYPCISWDGQFNGSPVTEGAYVYVIEALTITDRKISFTGNVTVIR